ncbi:uncharacterized protein LOC119723210 [Patiria miniata]|uniref:Potassium channel domain-containing protein n=1 Tax=Patiria miniata TaxID=46514 RepID=A0A913ZFF4_PATMI|nr:uncharacterized protein LOC119723210 [Patiria miniata]
MEGIPMENLPSNPAGLVAQSPAPAPTVLELDDAPLVEVPPTPKRRSLKAQCVYYMRIFLQFICSYVGLTAILAGYLVFGAFVFQAIEAPVETRMRSDMRADKKIFFMKMYEAAPVMKRENWTEQALYELNLLQKDFIHFYNYDLEVDGVKIQKWSFVGSMLFSLTVISTIGYGHIAPVTIPGQIFCILYALGGIPLMLLVLTNVGRVLANVARLLYIMYTSRLCQRMRMRCRQRRSRKRARKMARRRAMARKDSSRSNRSNRSRSNKSSKSRTAKKTASQATIRVDSEPYREGRPMSVNMELIRSDPPMPPPYDESNVIEDKISDTRENAEMFSEEADKPNMSEAPVAPVAPVHFSISPAEDLPVVFPLCSPPKQPIVGGAPKADMDDDFDDLSDLDEPEPEPEPKVKPKEQGEKPPLEFETKLGLSSKSPSMENLQLTPLLQPLAKEPACTQRDPSCSAAECSITIEEGVGHEEVHEKKLERASSSITLGEHCEKRPPPRQFSCLELRQVEEHRSISFNIEGIEEEEEVTPKEDDVFLPKESQSVNELNLEVTGSASDLNKNKKNRGKDKNKKKSKSKSKKDGESTGKARSSKHRKNAEVRIVERRKSTPKKLRTTKRPDMSPPTLRSLHSKQLKILNSATAVRLATYDKDFGNSREDLTTLIPALKHEKVRWLCEYDRGVIRNRMHNPRGQRRRRVPTSDSGSSRSRSNRGVRRRRKKGRESGCTTPLGSDRTSAFDSDTESTDTDDPGADPLQQAEIPIGPVLAFFFSYIAIGAIMFFFLMDKWNLFQSFYFCFITLTTIGFGDYVPDDQLSSLLACCMYTLVGMAVTSMCIALIMKKFVVTVKHIGRRVGIVGEDD